MNDLEILIKILKEQESKGGGNSKLTVSMLRFFLEEVEREKEQIEIDKQKEKDDKESEYTKFLTYYGI